MGDADRIFKILNLSNEDWAIYAVFNKGKHAGFITEELEFMLVEPFLEANGMQLNLLISDKMGSKK